MKKGYNRAPLLDNKNIGRCSWCFQGYCKNCTNDGADPERFCSIFCQSKFMVKEKNESKS